MVSIIHQILNRRQAFAMFIVAIVFGVHSSGVSAACGDYLHVKGRAPKPMNSAHSTSMETIDTQNGPSPQSPILSENQPAESPCRGDSCRNGHRPNSPVAPLATFSFDVDDVGVSNCRFERDLVHNGQRIRLTNARVPIRLLAAIHRPPG